MNIDALLEQLVRMRGDDVAAQRAVIDQARQHFVELLDNLKSQLTSLRAGAVLYEHDNFVILHLRHAARYVNGAESARSRRQAEFLLYTAMDELGKLDYHIHALRRATLRKQKEGIEIWTVNTRDNFHGVEVRHGIVAKAPAVLEWARGRPWVEVRDELTRQGIPLTQVP